jgi:ABC-type phosphate transport system permease subunit
MDKNQKLFKKKNNINSFVKSMSMGFSLLVGLIFFILIIFISIMAVKGFQEYGSGILFSGDFSEYSF